MVRLLRLLCLFGAFIGCAVSAADRLEYTVPAFASIGWHSTPALACSAAGAANGARNPDFKMVSATVTADYRCEIRGNNPGYQVGSDVYDIRTRPAETSCELNAEPDPQGGCKCKAGFINREGVGCVADQCKANSGKVGVVNWTEGYTATPNEGDRAAIGGYNKPPSDGNICENGCMVSAQTSGAGVTFFVSQQPTANGLYRRSADFPTVALGTPCTASEKAANSPQAPEPKCEGTVGQVNNKTVCVSTPAAPVTTTPMPAPSTTPIAGNPAAGAAPTSGEGSGTGSTGRTPDAGTGGNAGGSASAGVGGKGGTAGGTAAGTGTVKSPGAGEEQAACGAPGQPVCDVKVKEDGVEKLKAADSFKDADEELDKGKQTAKENRDKIAGTDDKGFFENFRSLWITPPLAACEPFVLPESVGSRTIDPCEVVDGVRSAMGYMWALGGLILCFGMIKRTI
jgi:hypothetical protein